MNRDMDVIRAIALATNDLPLGEALNELTGISPAVFAAHAQWMEEAGLVHAALLPKDGKRHATAAVVFRLTWQGCEFADAARSDTLWSKAKQSVIKPSAGWTFGILLDWLKTEIENGLPTLLG